MATVRIQGLGEVTLSVTELLELKNKMAGEAALKASAASPHKETNGSAARQFGIHQTGSGSKAVTMMQLIANAAPDSVNSEVLAKTFGVAHVKGLGSVLSRINKEIEESGYSVDRVYQRQRTPEGRVFTAGPDLIACLEAAQYRELGL